VGSQSWAVAGPAAAMKAAAPSMAMLLAPRARLVQFRFAASCFTASSCCLWFWLLE
jgi:hypothetical protein